MNTKYEKEFIDTLMRVAQDKKTLHNFLVGILTPAEHKEIVTRWQIVKRLVEGDTQRTIAKDLEVGIATVTRGSRELTNPVGNLTYIIKKNSKK